MKLPVTVVSEYRVHYLDLQDFVAKTYKMKDFDILLASGIRNGEAVAYRVTNVIPNIGNSKQRINSIRKGQRTKDIGLILQALCIDGHIVPGKYVLDTRRRIEPIEAYRQLLHIHQTPNHPECLAMRAKYQDKYFRQRADDLDKATLEHLR